MNSTVLTAEKFFLQEIQITLHLHYRILVKTVELCHVLLEKPEFQ